MRGVTGARRNELLALVRKHRALLVYLAAR